eukprot:gene5612-6470_t
MINARFACFATVMVALFVLARWTMVDLPEHDDRLEIDPHAVIRHTQRLIDIGNSRFVYEESRSLARDYIKDRLVEGGVHAENVLYHRFEWTESRAEGKNITKDTWTGINIISWSNVTALPGVRVRVIGAHYDTVHWGANRTAGAHDNLAGTGLLIEMATAFAKYAAEARRRPGAEPETPYMFVFFDHEEPGALGSRTFVEYYKMNRNNLAYFIDVDAVGHRLGRPIVQTYPYEHDGQTMFSPKWLVGSMVTAAYRVRHDGIGVGSPRLPQSLMYQAHRYHLLSIPFLSDDGPFTWQGIDSVLITDLDVFYGKNPDYHKITDQPANLDAPVLEETANILSHFLIATRSDDAIPRRPKPSALIHPILRLLNNLVDTIHDLLFAGHKQYLTIGPLCLASSTPNSNSNSNTDSESHTPNGDADIYYRKKSNQQQRYGGGVANAGSTIDTTPSNQRTISSHDDALLAQLATPSLTASTSFFPTNFRGYRLLFFHLFVLSIISLIDTVYTFEILSLAFLSLSTIHLHHYNLNLISGFTSGVFCANFIR